MIPQNLFPARKKAPQKWHVPYQYMWKLPPPRAVPISRGGAPKSSLHLLDEVQSKAICRSTIQTSPILSNLSPIFIWLQIFPFSTDFSWKLLSGYQEHHSWSNEAFLNNQKPYPISPFPSYAHKSSFIPRTS